MGSCQVDGRPALEIARKKLSERRVATVHALAWVVCNDGDTEMTCTRQVRTTVDTDRCRKMDYVYVLLNLPVDGLYLPSQDIRTFHHGDVKSATIVQAKKKKKDSTLVELGGHPYHVPSRPRPRNAER